MDRRQFITRGATLTAGMWAAPQFQSVAHAQPVGTPPIAEGQCTGQAYNVFLETRGLVDATVGPLNQSPSDQPFPETCITNLTANVVGTGGRNEVLVGLACVENDFNGVCCTRSRLTDVTVDLRDLIPVRLLADAITAEACAACGQEPTADADLANARIRVGNRTVNLASNPAPNTNVLNLSTGVVNVSLILNEQKPIPGGIEVNAVHLTVSLVGGTQAVEFILAHAEADVHDCP